MAVMNPYVNSRSSFLFLYAVYAQLIEMMIIRSISGVNIHSPKRVFMLFT